MSRKSESRFFRGSAGARRSEQERKAQEERRKAGGSGNRIFRFFVPVGETKEIVILDDQPDFYMWEHNYKGSDGKWGHLAGCCKEWETCPACEHTGSESYFGMYLTVLDLTPYTNRDGDTIEFSRKLMCVKPTQHRKFIRAAEKRGSLRGCLFEMSRDGQKDSAIGNDIEYVERLDEDELATYTREWTDKEGKHHTEDCSEPFVYEEIFEEPTPENIAKQIGIEYEAPPGSSRANEEALGEAEEDEGGRPSSRSRRSRRSSSKEPATSRSRRRTARDVDDGEDGEVDDDDAPWVDDEEEVEEEAPRKRTSRKAPARGRRGRR